MELNDIKIKIDEAAESSRDYIFGVADSIMKTPELGYKEIKTAEYVKSEFQRQGVFERSGIAYTGVRGALKKNDGEKKRKINVCVIGELDAVVCPMHPDADKLTGAAHACGHNGQLAVMLGVLETLKKSGIFEELDGNITFLAVPAEEMIDFEYRRSLTNAGKIKYFSGKQQLVYENEFDDIDICMMIHAQAGEPKASVYLGGSSLGFVSKTITFHGRAAHAGAAPFDGINALNAAMLAMMGMHVARETFRDEDRVRIHPIITKGGDIANIVPDHVVMENTVRAYNAPALADADMKAELAIKGACVSTRATATIVSAPGYLPLRQDKNLTELFRQEAKSYIPSEKLYDGRDMPGSSDIGDIGHLIPTIQPTMGGCVGSLHTNEFHLSDKEASLLIPVKIIAKICAELLYNNAEKAKSVISEFEPVYTKQEYLDYLDSFIYTKELP